MCSRDRCVLHAVTARVKLLQGCLMPRTSEQTVSCSMQPPHSWEKPNSFQVSFHTRNCSEKQSLSNSRLGRTQMGVERREDGISQQVFEQVDQRRSCVPPVSMRELQAGTRRWGCWQPEFLFQPGFTVLRRCLGSCETEIC